MKTRRYIILGIILILSSTNSLFAQSTGLYLNSSDFDSARTSFVKKEKLKYKFQVDNPFNGSDVKVVLGDSTFRFNKDSIFGYRDENKINYRFYHTKTYQILNPTEEILLYCITTNVDPKSNHFEFTYFFSINASASISPLTKFNLKRAFPNDSNFHELIDIYFNNDLDLLSYDSYYNKYKINRLYQLGKKIKCEKHY